MGGLLSSNTALVDLKLMSNEMGARGCAAVARAARSTALRGLDLSVNGIGGGDDGPPTDGSLDVAVAEFFVAVGR
jgi:hypothetical protein